MPFLKKVKVEAKQALVNQAHNDGEIAHIEGTACVKTWSLELSCTFQDLVSDSWGLGMQ